MNDANVMPENSTNAIVFNQSGNMETNILAPTVLPEYQCIVCKFTKTSPTEVHLHQKNAHTTEELSLSIIGLQILYNMHRPYRKESFDEFTTTKADLDKFLYNQKVWYNNEKSELSTSNIKSEELIYPEIQEEPLCLKISKSNSLLDTQTENSGFDINSRKGQKTFKKSRLKIPSTKITKPTSRKAKKVVRILPAISKLEESRIQSKSDNNLIEISNVTNLIKRDGNMNQNFLIRNENSNISGNFPICSNQISNNLLLKSKNIEYQVNKIIIQKSDNFGKSQTFLKIPDGKSEVTIEKIEPYFKKPEAVMRKPAVSIKRLGVTKRPKIFVEHQIKLEASEGKGGNFNKESENFCNDEQKNSLKRSSPKLSTEPSLQKLDSILEPLPVITGTVMTTLPKSEPSQILEPLWNSESFQTMDQVLQTPELPHQNLEPPEKKSKLPLELSNEEEVKNEVSFKCDVVEDSWYDSIKEKLYLENELPTDITKIAMQDFSNIQNFETTNNYFSNVITANQSLISPVDPGETWINSDTNPIYTELLPVYFN